MKFPLLILALSLAAFMICSAADEVELAVVVNKATAADSISSGDLRQMILGEKSKWPDGKHVSAVQTSLDSPERTLLLKVVYKMSEAVLKRYYMHAAFTGTDVVQPKDVASSAALKQFVASTPGAIGCILASDVDATVKVLKVDGSAPGEPGYKLR
jgi:ABC-type phosphate transport system substrate-binding protein